MLVVDADAFAPFARRLRADVEAELRGELPVAARKDRLFVLALLDGIDGRWPAAIARLDEVAALETEPRMKAMTGLTIRVWADAGGSPAAFEAALERAFARLPVAELGDQLAMLRAMGQAFTPDVCRRLVDESVHPSRGSVPFADAQTIAFQRYAVVRLVPVGATIDRVLVAHGIGLPHE